MNVANEKKNARAFLRWAGGKTWFVKHFMHLTAGLDFTSYHEPFLGGGAVFFSAGIVCKAYLSDINQDLIDSYNTLKSEPQAVIEMMKSFQQSAEFYYKLRKSSDEEPIFKAARFIYLNQTSFNGIYRVNLNGVYNVPYGYRSKHFLDEEALCAASARLQHASISSVDFASCKKRIKEKDLVFLDPPYTVSHNNNGFIKYNQKLFSLDDQERLSDFINYTRDVGAYYILTRVCFQNHKARHYASKMRIHAR